MPIFIGAVRITILHASFRNRAPIGVANHRGTDSSESQSRQGMGMTELEQRLKKEREEIAARVATFKATQEKFEREREEYFATTMRNAREGKSLSYWR
jgi:hypothetical protein